MCFHGRAPWHHLANTIEPSICGRDVALCQITLTSVVTVSKCFLSVGFRRFCRKNLDFRFDLGFHDKRIVNFFMTRVIWHDFHHR